MPLALRRSALSLVAAGRPLPEVLTAVTEMLEERCGPGAVACVVLYDSTVHAFHVGASPSQAAGMRDALTGLSAAASASAFGAVLARRERTFLPDITADPLWPRLEAALKPSGARTAIMLPVLATTGEPLGIIALFRRATESPSGLESSLMDEAGFLAGIAIERQRSDSRRRILEIAMAHANDVVLITEAEPMAPPGPRIVYVNEAFERTTGWRRDEVLGQTPRMLQGPGTDRATLDRLRAAMGRWEACRVELMNYRKGGEPFWVELEVTPFADDTGWYTHWVAVQRDITARKREEASRLGFQQQLQQTQKLEGLGVLAGGIAHDFNNLLVGVLGGAGLARVQLPSDSPVQGTLEQIETTARRAAELVRQLLVYAGQADVVIEEVHLSRLVREMGELLEAARSKQAELRFALAERLPGVRADAAQLRQVVMNLLTNASDAVHAAGGGVIDVSTASVFADRALLGRAVLSDDLTEGSYVELRVADSGVGMSRETMARIFDPFFTTKARGRGLGLAATLGIVRAHRGAVLLESAPGSGTTFTILLPAASTTAPAATGDGPTLPSVPTLDGRVLLVDDEPSVLHTAQRLLAHAGAKVTTAVDGETALRLVEAGPEAFDLVILDLSMPGKDGREVLKELRLLAPLLPVVLSSGYAPDRGDLEWLDGVTDFLQKPYTAQDLIETVRGVMGK
ncbi:MAG: response regulator [Gemmatimonadales bacterium]|nr:response regulator [Gemmatimonadales bacterium]